MIAIIPVEKNKEYELTIENVTSEGMGVGHIDGFCVFVEGAVGGDVVTVLILKVKSGYAYAKITSIIKASEDRYTPICHKNFKCGGCQLMHIKYEKQLEIKKEIIQNALLRIGGVDLEVSEMIGTDYPLRYRNKMIFPVGENKDNKKICGFYRRRSHDIIEIFDCFLGDEINSKIISVVMNFINKHNISAYNETTHSGVVRRIFTRRGFYTNEVMVVISVNADTLLKSDELVYELLESCSDIKSIVLNINKKKTNSVLGDKNIVIYGKGFIEDFLCGFKYEISPNSFYQVNPVQTEKLYNKAIELADIKKDDYVMDLYCGIGTVSLCAAKKAKKVTGVEIVEIAVENARQNAKRNGIENIEFFASDASKIVPVLIDDGERPDIVILDPPRKGSDEITLAAIVNAAPEKIVYISCNPATLARDVKFLSQNGYNAKKAVGIDMFAQTMHIETVVLLMREKSQKRVEFSIDVEKLQNKVAGYATYSEIKEYIEQNYGFKVSSLYIAQIKQKHSIIERENYNKGNGKSRCPECPPEKQKAIEDALRFFGMID